MDMTEVAKVIVSLHQDMIPSNKKIGVVVSGGLDSSVLWHMIYGECLKRNQECIPFTVPKVDGALTYATRMLEWSCEFWGTKRLHPWVINSDGVDWNREIAYQGEEVQQQLLGGMKEVVVNGYADVVFNGVNEYPPNYESLCSYHTPGPRMLSRDSDYIHEGTPIGEIYLQPFADLTKDKIVLLARELTVLNDISRFSHSCVELIRGRCGECFWCKEREWGFKQAMERDYGTA